jgi:ATP-dependent RNA helicase RhlE
MAFSFCNAEEREYLRDINKLIGKKIPAEAHPFEANAEVVSAKPAGRQGQPRPRTFRKPQSTR